MKPFLLKNHSSTQQDDKLKFKYFHISVGINLFQFLLDFITESIKKQTDLPAELRINQKQVFFWNEQVNLHLSNNLNFSALNFLYL